MNLTALVAGALAAASLSVSVQAEGIGSLAGKARPVVVFAGAQAPAMDQLERLKKARKALDERAMSVFVVGPSGVTTLSGGRAPSSFSADRLRKTYDVGKDEFAIVLIGKDGGEKLRSAEPVDASKLTDLVDTMPMRRNEAR